MAVLSEKIKKMENTVKDLLAQKSFMEEQEAKEQAAQEQAAQEKAAQKVVAIEKKKGSQRRTGTRGRFRGGLVRP